MKVKLLHAMRLLLAIVLGEAVLVIGTTFVQELLFGGIVWSESNLLELSLGSLASILAAAAAGATAYHLVRKRSIFPLTILSVLILIETFWLVSTGRTHDPLWFSLLGAVSLVFGVWIGKWAMQPEEVTPTLAG